MVAVVCGATVLAACGNGPQSAEEALASAQAYVADASSFRFVAATESTYATEMIDPMGEEGDSGASADPDWPTDPPGSTTTDRSTTSGAWTSVAWEARTEDAYGIFETKVFGTTAYLRSDMDDGAPMWERLEIPPMSRQDLVDELESIRSAMDEMEAESADEGDSSMGIVTSSSGESTALATSVYLGGMAWGGNDVMDDPSGFMRAITEMSDPVLVGRDDGVVTVSAMVAAPADVEEAWGAPLPQGEIDLSIAADGAPVGLRLQVGEGDDSSEVEIRFSEWNQPQDITQPSDDEVDDTPWIDEEAVAAVPGVTLLRPTLLPERWELDYVWELTGDDSAEGCDQVELGWSPMVSEGEEFQLSDDYLMLYLLPSECALENDDTPFEVGPFAPVPSRDGVYSVEVLVGDTAVQIDTTLTGPELTALVTSLAPTDVASLSAELSEAFDVTS